MGMHIHGTYTRIKENQAGILTQGCSGDPRPEATLS